MRFTAANERIAAIIPVFGARFLGQALESVFFQSRPPDEVIVVDDGSTDPQAVKRSVAPYGDWIRLLRQENRGAGAARNTGIAATSCGLIAFLDADDRWLPHFLRAQMEAFDTDSSVDLVYTDGLFVGHTPLAGRTFMSLCPSDGEVTLESLVAQKCNVLLSSVVARREAILSVGGFDAALRRGQDFDLWIRMARRGARMRYTRTVLTLYRRHDQALSGTPLNEIERPLAVLRKAAETMALSERERLILQRRMRVLEADLARERGKELLRRGDFIEARRAFARACRKIGAWKTHAARLGLYVAPHLVRRFYLTRLPISRAEESFRNNVNATSTLSRRASRMAGQFFSERTSVFHE